MLKLFLAFMMTIITASAAAQSSHVAIDRSRSSIDKNVFLTTSIEGEYGLVTKIRNSDQSDRQSWQGYGIRNGLGVEMMKFTQFSISHTLLNLRSAKSAAENLRGSRLSAEFALAFSAPLVNLQFGAGLVAANLVYQNNEQTASYTGVGRYYSLGVNHFVTPTISIQALGKRIETDNRLSGDKPELGEFNSKTDNISIGIAIWL